MTKDDSMLEERPMRVAEAMTTNPICCATETTVQEAAKLMSDNDCGCLPVVDADNRVMGVVTDRDIACRCVAEGKGAETRVSEAMTSDASCCGADDDLDEASRMMAEAQVRRVPVVDASYCCVGMVSQADIARAQDAERVGDVVAQVSQPTQQASSSE